MKVFYGVAVVAFLMLSGCSAEVGSQAWCKDMEQKSKGDWTANEASEYAKNCILR
ncbi:DUF3012 domain-containing protein [Thiosulfatimonas sediminis]|uniref:DUF3012 domain-containing protein n=1 Tax=Thiosulfatimonas sediminis TaxID=2675054 RepID=A0A6F8PUL3_9GAMM|nr:DUF3012 domain-containing protein [Thiosulfatimonas sediminis]BBP45799.1 DUF3012 domain-containing protein [Thiosulfatimonas sediminis]